MTPEEEHHGPTPWQTELDAKKFLSQVHMDFKRYLGTDFKLAKFTAQEKEFILLMVPAGISAFTLCPNPDVGEDIMQMDFAYVNTLAILNFNIDGNMIVDRITNWQPQEQREQHEELGFLDRLSKRIKGERKPKEIE